MPSKASGRSLMQADFVDVSEFIGQNVKLFKRKIVKTTIILQNVKILCLF